MRMKGKLKSLMVFWLPPLSYMVAIFHVSSLSHPDIGGETPDYVLHALEYFLLALLLIRLCLVLKTDKGELLAWRRACLLGMVLAISYGISDELHQYFVPGRNCSLHDVLADACGAFLAYGIAALDYVCLTRCRWGKSALRRFKACRMLSYVQYRCE